jgi:hypothetical protein
MTITEDKEYRNRQRFLEKSLLGQAQDASGLKVIYRNGRISPLVSLRFADKMTVQKRSKLSKPQCAGVSMSLRLSK